MVQVTELPRNDAGIETALGILKQRFGEKFQTGASLRDGRVVLSADSGAAH